MKVKKFIKIIDESAITLDPWLNDYQMQMRNNLKDFLYIEDFKMKSKKEFKNLIVEVLDDWSNWIVVKIGKEKVLIEKWGIEKMPMSRFQFIQKSILIGLKK